MLKHFFIYKPKKLYEIGKAMFSISDGKKLLTNVFLDTWHLHRHFGVIARRQGFCRDDLQGQESVHVSK